MMISLSLDLRRAHAIDESCDGLGLFFILE